MNTTHPHPDAPLVTNEFPDFPVETLPADLPIWMTCEAWHNDVCPLWRADDRFDVADTHLQLAIDYPDASMRECGGNLFSVYVAENDGNHSVELYSGDDWQAALVPLLAWRFAAEMREWLRAPEMAAANEANAAEGFDEGVCHTHDHCDANMAMDAAWTETMGRSFLPDDPEAEVSDADMATMNAAWSMAKQHRFWAPALHRYRPTLRPASGGGMPQGVAWDYVEAPAMLGLANRPDLPRSACRYGVVCTTRKLTVEECKRFDLVEA